MLKLTNVKKQYGDFMLDCSLEVKTGYVTGLIGQNGAGKSTVFKAVLDLIKIDGGDIEIYLGDTNKNSIQKKQEIGVSFADSGFSIYLNIKKIIPIMESMYDNFNKERFLAMCDHANLPLTKKIKEFSTGMKAKLKVLLAMSYDAKFLILDEPTAGLDVIARDELMDMLRDYMQTEDRAVLISSHISGDLEGLCDDIYMIDDGKIVLHEEMDKLLDEYGILKLTPEQFEEIDKEYLLKIKKEPFGYTCLTADRGFYRENYKDMIIEKGDIDGVMSLMIKGE